MRAAWLFPGQGAQTPGFLGALPKHAAVRATLAEAEQVLGRSCGELDSHAALQSTVSVQLGVLIAGVAYSRVLAAHGLVPEAVAGLSVGAFSAAVASGAVPFAPALRLVRLRAQAMADAYGGGGYGLLAVLGLGEAAVRELVTRVARSDQPLYLASVNAPAEIILAGSEAALLEAHREAARNGARARRLNVSVPSHCPLLAEVAASLREAMRSVTVAAPQVPYVGNVRGRLLYQAAEVAEDLTQNVAQTVRWHDSVAVLYERGVRTFIEMPPGRTLSTLVRSEFQEARSLAVAEAGLDSILHVLRR